MRICLVLEGSYPYVHGGVSTWMHSYIQAMPEHEFVLWVIGAKAADRSRFVYDLPGNVAEVHEVFLDDALRLCGEQRPVHFTPQEHEAPTGKFCSACFRKKRCIRSPFCRAVNS